MDGRCRVKLRSLATLCSVQTTDISCNQHEISITQNGKTQNFSFDHCLNKTDVEVVCEDNISQLDASVNMALLGFNSTVLLYDSSRVLAQNDIDSTFDVLGSVLSKVIDKLYSTLDLQQNQVSQSNNNNMTYTVTMSCFESLESQLRDLFVPLLQKTGLKPSKAIRIREKSDHMILIDGLTSTLCIDATTAHKTLATALNMRCCLVVGAGLDSQTTSQQHQSSAVASSAVIVGPVGNVFVQFTVKQVITSSDKSSTVIKEAIIELVSLATSETLTFRPSSTDNMWCMSRQEALDHCSSGGGPVNSEASKSSTTALLSDSLKSLSTLTRVVQVLRGNATISTVDATPLSSDSSAAPSKKKQHVPYRDCTMTRLLRRSLHGNCYMVMLTFVNAASGADNVARILRFAAEIGGLYNYISIKQQLVQSAMDITTRTSSIIASDGAVVADVDAHYVQEDRQDDSDQSFAFAQRGAQFASLFDLMQSDMEALSGDLSKLSADLFVASLQAVPFPTKQYSDNRASRGDRSDATNEVKDSLISDGNKVNGDFTDTSKSGVGGVADNESQTSHDRHQASIDSSFGVADQSSLPLINSPPTNQPSNSIASHSASLSPSLSPSKISNKLRTTVDNQTTLSGGNGSSGSVKLNANKFKVKGIPIVASSTPPRVVSDNGQRSVNKGTSRVSTVPSQRGAQANPPDGKGLKGESPSTITLDGGNNSSTTSDKLNANKLNVSRRSSSDATPGLFPALGDQTSGDRRVSSGTVIARATLSLPAVMLEDSTTISTQALLVTPEVMTESRRTILQLNIFKKCEEVESEMDSSQLTDRSTTSHHSSTAPAAPLVTVLPPVRAPLPVPPVVTLLTAGDIKRTVTVSSSQSHKTSIGGSLHNNPDDKLAVNAQEVIDRSGDKESAPSKLFMTTERVPGGGSTDSLPTFVDKYSLNGSEVSPKKVVVVKRRFQVEEDDDSGGDDLSEPERRFLRHCAAGQVSQAEKSLQMGVNVHVKNNFERDAMQICARNGSVPMLMLLFKYGGLLSSRGPKGDTLFHLAAWNGHVSALRWLHSSGILPAAVDILGQTAVHVAARRGEVAVLQYLYEELNLDLQQLDFDGRLPLDHVGRRGGPELEACRNYLQLINVRLLAGNIGFVTDINDSSD